MSVIQYNEFIQSGTRTLSISSSTVIKFQSDFQTTPIVFIVDKEYNTSLAPNYPWIVGGVVTNAKASGSTIVPYTIWEGSTQTQTIIFNDDDVIVPTYANGESGTLSTSSTLDEFGAVIPGLFFLHSGVAGTVNWIAMSSGWNIPNRFKVSNISTGSFTITPMKPCNPCEFYAIGVEST